MRLSNDEKKGLIKAISVYITDYPVRLYLYGSRIKDELKGGDIDLLLVADDSAIKTFLQTKKHYILAEMKEQIGEQKIDLLITEKSELATDPFLKIIFPTAQLLYQW